MEDYPRTLQKLEGRFTSEEACREYLARLRWPEGFVCPRCAGQAAWRTARGLFRCTACDHQASITAGTIFQDSRLPLRTWFRAIWWVTSQKTGASALGLQRILGFGSYRTAWALLQKLRRKRSAPGVSGGVPAKHKIEGERDSSAYPHSLILRRRQVRFPPPFLIARIREGPRQAPG